jgi:transposase InsO family protein
MASIEHDGRLVLPDALEDALRKGRPEIFNTDQGAQFTSAAFNDKLEAAGVRVSMDGRRRWLDNASSSGCGAA